MPYEIVVAEEAWERFWSYVDECPDEVAAFGYITPDEELDALYVSELFLVPQTVHGTEVDFTSEGLPYAVDKAVKDGRIEELRFCVHSHVNMGTGFSNTDDDMIEKMGENGAPWFASAVFNKKGDTNARVDLFAPMLELPGVKHFEVKADIYCETARIVRAEAKAELAQFVKKAPKPQVTYAWKAPTKDTAGKTPQFTPQPTQASAPQPGKDWFEDDELQRELDLWIEARKQEWTDVEDTDGFVHFYDDNGVWKGSAHALDEGAVDWFIAKHDLHDGQDEDRVWHLIEALEDGTAADDEPNRENTP